MSALRRWSFAALWLLCALCAPRVARAQAADAAQWIAIAGIRAQPLPHDARPQLSRDAVTCHPDRLGACATDCRDGKIDACAQLVDLLLVAREAPAELAQIAVAFDRGEDWFRTACDLGARPACDAARSLRFVRYLLGCRFADSATRYPVGERDELLRSGACRGVVRLLESPAFSVRARERTEGRAALDGYCEFGWGTTRDDEVCALAIALYARTDRVWSESPEVLDACKRTLGERRASEVWRSICNEAIDQRRWPLDVLRSLCATPESSLVLSACASFAPDPPPEPVHGPQRYLVTRETPRETLWFDGPIGATPELRAGLSGAPQALALEATLGVGVRLRWHWFELVAAADVGALIPLRASERGRLALDVALQPGVVFVTHGPRRSSSITPSVSSVLFTMSAGALVRGGPAIDLEARSGWIGAVGGYLRAQWHASPTDARGGGLQLELTAPTWNQGDPVVSGRLLCSF